MEKLENQYDVTMFFYNPNIHPLKEMFVRQEESVIFAKKKDYKLIVSKSEPQEWFNLLSHQTKWSTEKSGERCYFCYKERLEKTANFAKKNNYDIFATTMTVSPYRHTDMINDIGNKISKDTDCEYLPSDFNLNNGYKRSLILSKEENMYRQNYCGCVFSRLERMRIKPYNKKHVC
jgi:epoxyqueuosine reductase